MFHAFETSYTKKYVVGSKSFRPNIQKSSQITKPRMCMNGVPSNEHRSLPRLNILMLI